MSQADNSNPTGSINANPPSMSQFQASGPAPHAKPTFKDALSTSGIFAPAPSALGVVQEVKKSGSSLI
jgi:hypothetical protein